jgi:assimilatory nitrate reductase catalytic subunit
MLNRHPEALGATRRASKDDGAKEVRTTCPYCGVGCGLVARPNAAGALDVEGDPQHPANYGKICSKGAALGETISLDGRLLHPMLRQADGTLARSTWPKALDRVAHGLKQILERDGPDAIAFYLSGQLLTEDYYVANKLMKGFIGSANVDTNSRLCMASSVAGHRRAFGSDTVPGTYTDLDEADLIVLVGSNAAWCHPVLFQRIMENRAKRGARVVVIDPRRTATAEEADLFLPIEPGKDTALFCGLLVHLAECGAIDWAYIGAHTTGFAQALARARALAPHVAATAGATGLRDRDVETFFEWFRSTARAVTCYSQGVNQSAQGTDKVNAIINCQLATGRIGKIGMGPLSLTGQPNAMGGREVGGLANQLAAHMGFAPEEIDRVRRFWNAPRMAEREGKKAVDMFAAIERGEIKFLWVMATNPAVSLPRAGAVRAALKKLELLVVSENVLVTETTEAAHVLLPAAAWGEKDGTVTNSERRISRQRAFLPPPGEAKPDWWIVAQVAQRMGFAGAFSYESAADVFREHAALSAFENDGTRDFDLGALADLSDSGYDALVPLQWPVRSGEKQDIRFFAEGNFFTPDRRARFVTPECPELKEKISRKYPLRLNTGRVRDQWHTMTRTGKSPRLAAHCPEPFVEIHPRDASKLADGGFARVITAHGSCVLRVVVTKSQRPGSIFVPIHWNDQTASCARVGELVAAHVDPYSGQPEAKATPCAIEPVEFALRGCAQTRAELALPRESFWTRVAVKDGWEYRLATSQGPMIWHDFVHGAFGADARLAEKLEQRVYQAAAFADGVLEGWFCLGPEAAALRFDPALMHEADARVEPAWAAAQYAHHIEPVVCACFGTREESIRCAIGNGARDAGDIGKLLGAGTNCGSCLPELKRIIRHEHATAN